MDIQGKYIIAFDTICDGNQTSQDENGLPTLYDSEQEAFKELFTDAIAGLEGTDDSYFEDVEIDKEETISKMNSLLEEGDHEKMKAWLDVNHGANYNTEFVEKAEDFVLGRKAIFTGQGVVIEGTKLEDL